MATTDENLESLLDDVPGAEDETSLTASTDVDTRLAAMEELNRKQASQIEQLLAALAGNPATKPQSAAGEVPPEVLAGDAIMVHFTEDGFTFGETVWYAGQELIIDKGTAEWDLSLTLGPECRNIERRRVGQHVSLDAEDPKMRGTCTCRTIFAMTENEQMVKYRRVYFKQGPWKGAPWQDEAAEAEARRRGRLPTPLSVQ